MINLIIWSKDRAPQLHLLLESIERFAPDTFRPSILYAFSHEKYQAGYEILKGQFPDVGFFLEGDKHRLGNWTKECIKWNYEQVAFSTDDTVLFSHILPFNEWKHLISDDIVSFSLRYGFNTIVQNYHTGELQPPIQMYDKDGQGAISWFFSHYHPLHNYGYPFGLDMHIYRRELLLILLKNEEFKTTNELETLLFNKKSQSPQRLRSFATSKAVNIPVNNLSGITLSGKDFDCPMDYLNDEYLLGKRINLQKIVETDIRGSHQEIALEFDD